jgi:hypothetical protein
VEGTSELVLSIERRGGRFVSSILLESISIEPTQSSEHLRPHLEEIVGAGFAPSDLLLLHHGLAHHLIHADSLRVTHCPFTNLPERKDSRWSESLSAEKKKRYRWVKPKPACQVAFVEWEGLRDEQTRQTAEALSQTLE